MDDTQGDSNDEDDDVIRAPGEDRGDYEYGASDDGTQLNVKCVYFSHAYFDYYY